MRNGLGSRGGHFCVVSCAVLYTRSREGGDDILCLAYNMRKHTIPHAEEDAYGATMPQICVILGCDECSGIYMHWRQGIA